MIRLPTTQYYQGTIDAARGYEPGPRAGAVAVAAVLDTCLLPPRVLLGYAGIRERHTLMAPGRRATLTHTLKAHGAAGIAGIGLSKAARVGVQVLLVPQALEIGCIALVTKAVSDLLPFGGPTQSVQDIARTTFLVWMEMGELTERGVISAAHALLGATIYCLDKGETGLVVASACISACLTGSLPSFWASFAAHRAIHDGMQAAPRNWPAATQHFQRAITLQPQAPVYALLRRAAYNRFQEVPNQMRRLLHDQALQAQTRLQRDVSCDDVAQAMRTWAQAAGSDTTTHPDPAGWELSAEQRSIMVAFTDALKQARDFRDGGVAKRALAGRVLSMFERFDQFPTARVQVLDVISDLENCADRRIMVFQQAEEVLDICQAQQSADPRATLQGLGQRQIVRDIIRKHAARVAGTGLEGAEVFLYLDMAVSRALGVQAAANNMLHPQIGQRAAGAIAAATREARAAIVAGSPAHEAFFASWEPWQLLSRREQAAATQWAALKADDVFKDAAQNERCFITLEDVSALEEPMVMVHNGQRIYMNFAEGMHWWAENGRHPTSHERVNIDTLRRVI